MDTRRHATIGIVWTLEVWDYKAGGWRIQTSDRYPKTQGEWLREWFEEFQRESPARPRRIKAYVRWSDVLDEQRAVERAVAWAKGPEIKWPAGQGRGR
jgi:hypothetical protein